MDSHWSRIPPEITHEITAHNEHDVPTLRAMCLVSRATRSLAIIHLFSLIHFVCLEDLTRWIEMLERTPTLATVVKRVKFSLSGSHRHLIYPAAAGGFFDSLASDFPTMPPFPNVRSVEYDGEYMYRVAMKTMSTSLFPQVEELRLAGFSLESLADLATIVSRCGRLKSLSLDSIHVGQRESPVFPTISESTNPDLTTLEELVVKGLGIDPGNFIAKLLQQYPSHSLRTLAFNHCDENQACSVDATEKLLQSFAPSLVNLVIDPSFAEIDDNSAMFGRLPVFSALESLTVWLEHSRCAEDAIRTLQAPNLTRLIFRLDLPYLYYDDVRDDFGELLEEIFPWNTSESVKATISRKFPSCRRIAFHFCIPKDSQMHYRRGMRRRMERLLKRRMEKIGADIEGYLQVEWLDEAFQPVQYQRANGKPNWIATWFKRDYPEPETENSDCEEPEKPHDIQSDWNPEFEFYPYFGFDD